MRNKSKLRDQNEKASAVKFATRRKKGFGGGGRKHVKWASEWPVYRAPMYGLVRKMLTCLEQVTSHAVRHLLSNSSLSFPPLVRYTLSHS